MLEVQIVDDIFYIEQYYFLNKYCYNVIISFSFDISRQIGGPKVTPLKCNPCKIKYE